MDPQALDGSGAATAVNLISVVGRRNPSGTLVPLRSQNFACFCRAGKTWNGFSSLLDREGQVSVSKIVSLTACPLKMSHAWLRRTASVYLPKRIHEIAEVSARSAHSLLYLGHWNRQFHALLNSVSAVSDGIHNTHFDQLRLN